MSGPTTGASDPVERSWAASPAMAWVVRALVFLAPLVVGWAAVRGLSALFFRPEGWVGVVCWGLQALVVASVTAAVVDRAAQRLLPLVTLMGMSMTFPDQAPSRFGLALRAGTVRQLRTKIESLERDGLGDSPQQAAERAIELVTVLSRHDRLTRGHTERVRAYADLIAVELGLDDHDRQLLAWGVTLHDIGKLTVPPEILNKDGRPTEEEWAILSAHPATGAAMLEPLAGWLGEWVNAAAQHHERWDGNGYPNRLAGTQISLAGRITAVADAYDVITSHRSYKAPMSIGAARKELVDCAGTQFDPDIVRALLQASVRRHRPTAGIFSWLPELPGLATIAQGVSAAPAAVATVAIAAAAPLTGITPPEPPSELAYIAESAPVSVDAGDPRPLSDDDRSSDITTAAPNDGTDRPGASVATPSGESTTSTTLADRETTDPTTDEPGTSVPVDGTTSSSASTPITSTTTASTPLQSTTTAGMPSSATTPTTAAGSSTSTAPTSTATTTVTTTSTTAGAIGPTAADDAGTQGGGQQKQYAVLDNDNPGDAPLDPSTLDIVTPPSHGTVEPWASTKLRYQAAGGYTGTVAIVYRICDTNARCSQATLTVTLTP